MSKIPISLNEDFERELQKLKKENSYEIFKIVGLQPKQLDFAGYIRDFCEANSLVDNSVDGTSNQSVRDVVALENDISKPILKMVAFNKIYTKLAEKYGDFIANDWLKSEFLGASYLHDAHTSTLIPYCYAYDLTRLASEGLFFLNSFDTALYCNKPANHLDVFVNHLKEYVSFCCNRQAGAVGLPNLLLWMYYFWQKDVKEGYNGCKLHEDGTLGVENAPVFDDKDQNIKYFKQCTQSLIYALNQPYLRNSIQTAFTNVSIFDQSYAHALFDGVTFPDGSLAFDVIDNIVKIQMLFMQVVADIRHENMFTFPVLTISLLVDKDRNFINPEFARWASDHNCIWNDSNFFIDDSVTSLSNCCRLKSDISDMMDKDGYFNSIGGTALSIGSIKVNSVNLAHIAYETIKDCKLLSTTSNNLILDYFAEAESLYIEKLKKQVNLNMMCLDVIRDILITNKDKRHLLPNIDDGLIDMKHMYNTVGVIGVYEVLKTFQNKLESIKETFSLNTDEYDYIKYDKFGNIYYTKYAEKFVKNIFETMQNCFKQFKLEHNLDYNINCEQIPGETAAKKLMQKDVLQYGDMTITDLPLYSNQFIPLGIKTTLEERVRVAALFDNYLNGGSICHINVESPMPKDMAWEKLNWIAKEGLTYSAFTTKISACKHNHAYFGSVCPICGEPTITTYARIVGFYTPTGFDNKGEYTGKGTWSEARCDEFKLRQWD